MAGENEGPRGGLTRVSNGAEDDEGDEKGGSATTPAARPVLVSAADSETGDLRAEVDRLRAENARLSAVAGLEGRRDEPATVGDVLDALEAERAVLRAELEQAIGDYGDDIVDAFAGRTEARLLDSLNGESEPDEPEDDATAKGKGRAKSGAKKTSNQSAQRSVRELDGPFVDENHRLLFLDRDTGETYRLVKGHHGMAELDTGKE